jgi:hypothetical protein
MRDTYDEAVHQLAEWHAEGAKPKVTVYAIPDPQQREVRLLEVSLAFPEAGQLIPVTIGPTPDFPYTSGTLCVAPVQLRSIKSGELLLPEGWDFRARRKVWPGGHG